METTLAQGPEGSMRCSTIPGRIQMSCLAAYLGLTNSKSGRHVTVPLKDE